MPTRVLQVAAEIFPLVKTGGLADVVAALPPAMAAAGADVRLLLPGLPQIIDAVTGARTVVDIGACFGALRVRLLRARMPGNGLPVYVVDAPHLYRRSGGPYQAEDGQDWPDNLQRFALLGWVAARLASGDADPDWTPNVVHAHDWHAAMACAYIADHPPTRAVSVFTIHNLAYQGLFAHDDWTLLGLSSRYMSPAGFEFHGQLCFMKAGLQYARRITTVSPTYAREITTHQFGCGLEGVIAGRASAVHGIVNGIDTAVWDPATDASLEQRYDAERLQGKAACRRALQASCHLALDEQAMVVTVVSRLTWQKGLDMLLEALPQLVAEGVQLVIQGTGDPALESAFRQAQQAHPGRVWVSMAYNEARAHQLIAGADVIAVPSRFEPCGLTQLYGLRYGTLPVVHRVGGLSDTVEDGVTGFCFEGDNVGALRECLRRAAHLRHSQPEAWRAMMLAAMGRDLSWDQPAQRYLALYNEAMAGGR